jgi:hypothetical protein
MRAPPSGTPVQAKVRLPGGAHQWLDGTFRSITPNGKYMVNVCLPDGTKKVVNCTPQTVRRAETTYQKAEEA